MAHAVEVIEGGLAALHRMQKRPGRQVLVLSEEDHHGPHGIRGVGQERLALGRQAESIRLVLREEPEGGEVSQEAEQGARMGLRPSREVFARLRSVAEQVGDAQLRDHVEGLGRPERVGRFPENVSIGLAGTRRLYGSDRSFHDPVSGHGSDV